MRSGGASWAAAGRGNKKILIPFAENVHTLLAVEMAPALLEHFRAKALVAVVFGSGTSPTAREEELERVRETIRGVGLQAELQTIVGRGVVEGIARESLKADLILMGGRSADFLGLLFANSLTQEITERVACPVLWVKGYEERLSFWASLFQPAVREVEKTNG